MRAFLTPASTEYLQQLRTSDNTAMICYNCQVQVHSTVFTYCILLTRSNNVRDMTSFTLELKTLITASDTLIMTVIDEQTYRWTEKLTDGQTTRQTDRQTDRETERQTHRQRDRQRNTLKPYLPHTLVHKKKS